MTPHLYCDTSLLSAINNRMLLYIGAIRNKYVRRFPPSSSVIRSRFLIWQQYTLCKTHVTSTCNSYVVAKRATCVHYQLRRLIAWSHVCYMLFGHYVCCSHSLVKHQVRARKLLTRKFCSSCFPEDSIQNVLTRLYTCTS